MPDVGSQLFSGLDLVLSSLGASRDKREAGYDKVTTARGWVSRDLTCSVPGVPPRGPGCLHWTGLP